MHWDDDDWHAPHRLRYQVYCLERQFLDLTAHPEGRERDEFDAHAIHFAATDEDGEVVATARLVLDSPLGFPLERRAVDLAPEYKNLPRARTGEIGVAEVIDVVCRRAASIGVDPFLGEDRQAVGEPVEHEVFADQPVAVR